MKPQGAMQVLVFPGEAARNEASAHHKGLGVEEHEVGVATEFYLDRPPVPLFTPRMPAKDNCKSTQIYDGDYELFDFDREVEPMLNVLIEKTLD